MRFSLSVIFFVGLYCLNFGQTLAAPPNSVPQNQQTPPQQTILGPTYLDPKFRLLGGISGGHSSIESLGGDSIKAWIGRFDIGVQWREFLQVDFSYERGWGEEVVSGRIPGTEAILFEIDRFGLAAGINLVRVSRFRLLADVQGFYEDLRGINDAFPRFPPNPIDGSSTSPKRFGISLGHRVGLIVFKTNTKTQLSVEAGCRINGYINPQTSSSSGRALANPYRPVAYGLTCRSGFQLSFGL